MNYWYVARPNELFLDIDNAARSLKHARARLQGAIECGKLDVAHVMQRPSKSKDHIHVIIALKNMLYGSERYSWEIILHSDLYRSACNMMRLIKGVGAPDVIISPFPFFSLRGIMMHCPFDDRNYDDKCECASKHNAATMQTCPAAIRLRGEFRNAGFFGKPSKNPCTIWPEL